MANSQTVTFNIKAVADMKDVQSNIQNIQNALSKLKLPDNLKTSFKQTFTNLDRELENYQRLMQSGFKNKGDANALEKSGNNIIRLYDEIVKKINSIDDSTLKKAFEDLGAKEVENLRQELNGLENDLKSKLGNQKFIDFSATKASLKDFTSQFKDAEGKINSTFKTLSNSTINTFFKNIDIGRLDLAASNLDKIEQQVKELNNTDLNTWFNQLKTGFIQLTSDAGIQGTVHAVEELKQKLATVEANTLQNLINGFKEGKISAEQFQQELTKTVTAEHELAQAQVQTNKEIDQVKSRIQYFFGLNNAINLVKRAIRGAVETVKELDAAMTETAVVTNYTVKDMWNQLPEYTKRANELGVTTKDAYESATLYFQQGLNADQAAALSTETLKMARIAGLDAAEATDRMTNALRGFNMELDTASAQRVDDVYSELAAISASDVDEISTAMTKVASLAHSANMEFETTAAFLAQIIETTRESAETAGTALKTVAARFSEVKKLVDTNQLKGTDEEGQVVDVNKVSTALRTAGIDLNKYFLGEVGLDDIFMELASKWDSLTSVQQRYIATQAAGSRQQSRFIALMQDYARTQELVSAAYNANGASARQFEKTQDSLQSKLARLKNAWNEFLMGLANNAVIKGVVDLLTNLLNIINSLTSAFGEGVGGILKWVTAIGAISGLRAAFSDKGIATKAIGTLINGTPIGNLLGKARGATALQGSPTANGQGPRQATIIGNVGNIFKKVPSGLAKVGAGITGKTLVPNGTQLLGGSALITESAAIATALGTITAAIVAAAVAYQLWLHNSAKGKLKLAEKEAEKLQKQSDEAEKSLKSLNSLQDTYKEKSEEVDKATNAQDRFAAIKERNEAILDAIKEDGTLAQYVITEEVDNEIVLRVDEASLAAAAQKASEEAAKAAVAARFAEGGVDLAQANVYEKELKKIIWKTTGEFANNLNAEEAYNKIMGTTGFSAESRSQASELYNQIIGARASAEQQAKIAYGEELSKLNVKSELTNALLPVLGEIFKTTGKEISVENLKNLTGMGKGGLTSFIEAWSGTGKMSTISLTDANVDIESDNFLKLIGLDDKQLEDFSRYLGISVDKIKAHIKEQAKENKAIQQSNQAKVFEGALKANIPINQQVYDQIKSFTPEYNTLISDIIPSVQNAMTEAGFKDLMTRILDESLNTTQLQQIQDFYNNFNLDNPIQAFHNLKEAQKEATSSSYFAKFLKDVEEANKAVFDTGNLVQTFLTSASYDSLSESIEKFIEANGRVTSKNIEELTDSCKELEYLLEDETLTVQGLAEAFTLLEDGVLVFDAITTSLLAALSAGESFNALIDKVDDWIESFNEGTDLTKGTEHIVDVAEKAAKYIEGWQFGNEPLMNIYDHLFGEGAYDAYMKSNWGKKSFDQLEAELGGQISRISEMAQNEGLGALQFLSTKGIGITDKGNNEFSWDLSRYADETHPVQVAIQDVATQLGVTQDAARAFIESWASHMWDLRQEWNDLNFGEAMQSYVDEMGNAQVITEQELAALAASTGKTANEIIAEINRLRSEAGEPIAIRVSWQNDKGQNLTGDELINRFNTAVDVGTREVARRRGEAPAIKDDYSKLLGGIKDVGRTVETELGTTLNTLDFDTLHNHLVEAFKLTPAQATEVADHIAEQTGKSFTKEIQVPIRAADGSIETETQYITATTSEGLQAGIDAAMQAANYALVAEQLASQDVSTVGDNLGKSIEQGGTAGVAAVQEAINGLNTNVIVSITYQETNSPPELATGGMVTIHQSRASGGLIESYAKGSENFHVSAGTALTGEEGPELVWNKDNGYAYVTGQDGPEFADLRPGDRIFNASETKRIFANSRANGGVVDSFASGGWKTGSTSSKKSGGSSGSGSGGADDKTPEEWKNDLDWLYNLMEDIVELERDQKVLEETYEDYLQDESKTGRDLYNLLVKQLGNLYTQLNHQTFALEKREQEMREFMDTTNDQDQYLWYNWKDRTLEIDWDAIDQIQDEEQYKHVKELVDEAEEIQDKMDDAEDAVMDITNQIQELENIWRDTFVDFEDRVLNAVIKSYQTVIDNYSELNDTLNDSNQQILDSLQKEISLQRQIRDNTKTEEEISDDEARLAYLRRDTSGGNDLAALQLQKQLDENRQNYEDSLIDQAIGRLQEDNDAAAQQREKQIEIMQAQLDYQSENGEFNAYISELLTAAMGAEGELLTNSDLVDLLKEQENWAAMSDVSKQVWDEELNGTFKEVAAFILKQNAEENGTFYTALTKAVESVSSAIGSYSQAMTKIGNQISSAASGGGYGGSSGGSSGTSPSGSSGNSNPKEQTKLAASATYNKPARTISTDLSWKDSGLTLTQYFKKYATGGLATSTGPAWLDGTSTEPEYVLNARQTDAFLRLADILPSMMGSGGGITNTSFGNNQYNVSIHVDQLASDYDVDRMVDRVKEKLYDTASYRNVNALSFLR